MKFGMVQIWIRKDSFIFKPLVAWGIKKALGFTRR